MLDETLWDEVVDALPTERPVVRVSLQGPVTMADLVKRVGQAAPPPFIIAGFSLGGYIARAVAQRFPERVAGLILIATSLRPDTPAQQASKQHALSALAEGAAHGVSRNAIKRTLHHSRASDVTLIKRIHAMSVGLGRETFAAQLALVRSETNMVLTCPTLMIAGRDDPLRSLEEAREMQLSITGSQLKIIEETGHMIPLEQPKVLSRVMTAWLTTKGL
jgi:pimeloyl-ACP methyl ester carboxylesterase